MSEWKSNESQQREKSAAVAVPGMFYYLGPIAVIVMVALFALWLLNTRDEAQERMVPTTGMDHEAPDTPGGINPEPQHESTGDELEFRGGDQR
jgi:hypothetical protein